MQDQPITARRGSARPSSRSSPIPTTSRWPAAARSPGSPTPAHGSSWCARPRGERGSAGRPGPRRRARRHPLARVPAAGRLLGIADVILLDHPDGDLRWAHVAGAARATSSRRSRDYEPAAVITFGEDGLYWHQDHIAVHERATTAVQAFGSGGAGVVLRHDAARHDARDRRRRHRTRLDADAERLLEPDAGRVRPARRAAHLHRRRRGMGAAEAGGAALPPHARWGRTTRSTRSPPPTRAGGWASSSSAARQSAPTATPCSRRSPPTACYASLRNGYVN